MSVNRQDSNIIVKSIDQSLNSCESMVQSRFCKYPIKVVTVVLVLMSIVTGRGTLVHHLYVI